MTASTDNRSRRWIRLAVGVALSGAALALALSRAEPGRIADTLAGVRWGWLPIMVALKAGVLGIKDLRWRCELRAMAPARYRRTFRAIGLGYFGNLLLPFKLGERLRVGLLVRHNPGVRAGDALATVAAERALDGAVLALVVGAALPAVDVPGWVKSGTGLLLVAMLAVIAISMLKPLHDRALRWLPRGGVGGWARKVVSAASEGTAVLRTPGALAQTTAYTALAWLGESLVFFGAVQALGLEIPYQGALVVTLLLAVGLLVPSAPGQIGTHQALSVLFLGAFGVTAEVAISASLLLQAVGITTLGSIGGYVLVREAGARDLVVESQRGPGPPDS